MNYKRKEIIVLDVQRPCEFAENLEENCLKLLTDTYKGCFKGNCYYNNIDKILSVGELKIQNNVTRDGSIRCEVLSDVLVYWTNFIIKDLEVKAKNRPDEPIYNCTNYERYPKIEISLLSFDEIKNGIVPLAIIQNLKIGKFSKNIIQCVQIKQITPIYVSFDFSEDLKNWEFYQDYVDICENELFSPKIENEEKGPNTIYAFHRNKFTTKKGPLPNNTILDISVVLDRDEAFFQFKRTLYGIIQLFK